MRPAKNIYPALGRYFDTTEDLASAACMKRSKLHKCLKGEQNFTPSEKRAIVTNIIARMCMREIEETDSLNIETLYSAYHGHFDEVFKAEVI